MTTSFSLSILSSATLLERKQQLIDVLEECVKDGASVSFMLPFDRQKACSFWEGVARSCEAGERRVFIAQRDNGDILGTVQLITAMPDNQPHRGEVAKLLVRQCARRQGVARALMTVLEESAATAGKSLLVLDTATGSGAEIFYQQAGWQKAGEIPQYALMPDGTPCGTSVFYKSISSK